MSIGAMRQFNKTANKDLWHTLVQVLETYMVNVDKPLLTILERINANVSYFDAAKLFHALAQQENKSVSLEEIEDAMFRVGMIPVKDENSDLIEPWPLVLAGVANEVKETISEVVIVKKKQPTGKDTKKKPR